MLINQKSNRLTLGFSALLVCCVSAMAQTTSFTYQGKLMDGGAPASGPYQMQFSLHSAASGVANQIGSTITIDAVTVTNGTFTVELNFTAANAFDGSARWLQIAVRKPSDPSFAPLNPRQPITSTPYSIKSLNATTAGNSSQLGGVAANQYVVTTDPRMTDARPPTAGSGNYIQSNPASPQAGSFNISGNGQISGVLNAGGLTVRDGDVLVYPPPPLLTPSRLWITSSGTVAFGGSIISPPNTGGHPFRLNVIEPFTNGLYIETNTGGGRLAEFGSLGDFLIDGGFHNNFVAGGRFIVKEGGKVGIGTNEPAARLHVVGASSFPEIPPIAVIESTGDQMPLAFKIGATEHARIRSDNAGNLVLATLNGGAKDIYFRAGDDSGTDMFIQSSTSNVGIGTNSPAAKLEIQSGGNFEGAGDQKAIALSFWNGGFRHWIRTRHNGFGAVAGNAIDFFVNTSTTGGGSSAPATGNVHVMTLDNGNVGIRQMNPTQALDVAGWVKLSAPAAGAGAQLCRNATTGVIVDCSASSARHKENVFGLRTGLGVVRRLRPVSFTWKGNGERDLGLVAEEVAEVAPLLVTRDDKGAVAGVRYDRLGVVLVNVAHEQQAQIESLRKLIETQQQQIDALKKLVCATNLNTAICRN